MDQTYWQRQTADMPRYPDLLWSRPENRAYAGKLLVIGGNMYGFAAAADAYRCALQSGAGAVRVLLPDSLKQTVGQVLETGDFAPSTLSGSFSQKALTEFQVHAAWADSVLVAGDLGRNSETAIALEKFVEKYSGQLILSKDAADYFTATPRSLLGRPDTMLVLSFAQLQKLATSAAFVRAFTFSMDLLHLVETLHDFTTTYGVHLIVKHLQYILAASGGNVSSTKLPEELEIWRVKTAAAAAVWWLQNPAVPFAAATTAVYDIVKHPQ